MKLILTVFVVTVFLAGVMATASAADVLDLSTLGKKTSIEAISLPQVSPNMPTIAPTALGGNVKSNVLDLSTLGKKARYNVIATMIKGPTPVTVTPMFAVKNTNADQPGWHCLHSASGHFRQRLSLHPAHSHIWRSLRRRNAIGRTLEAVAGRNMRR